MNALELRRDLIVLACAASAGIHAALVPDHFAESTGAGVGFVAATAALAAVAVAVTLRPASGLPLAGAATVLAGLLAAYALAITSGVPLVHPDREAVDALAVATKAIEAVGLIAAAGLLGRRTSRRAAPQLVSLAVGGGPTEQRD